MRQALIPAVVVAALGAAALAGCAGPGTSTLPSLRSVDSGRALPATVGGFQPPASESRDTLSGRALPASGRALPAVSESGPGV